MVSLRRLLLMLTLSFAVSGLHAETIMIAAAADLKFALDEIITNFRQADPDAKVEVVYGSSGNFNAQIRQGAPFDLYFSADIAYPQELAAAGWAASQVHAYATGRLVVWSTTHDVSDIDLADLADRRFQHIAIANPRHAPYGKRAEEALRAAGVWEQIEAKLVLGENVAQAAQFVQTGNADIGIIALSLILSPGLKDKGTYWLIPETLHAPLDQGYIVTRRAKESELAARFAEYMQTSTVRSILDRYGFARPAPAATGSTAP